MRGSAVLVAGAVVKNSGHTPASLHHLGRRQQRLLACWQSILRARKLCSGRLNLYGADFLGCDARLQVAAHRRVASERKYLPYKSSWSMYLGGAMLYDHVLLSPPLGSGRPSCTPRHCLLRKRHCSASHLFVRTSGHRALNVDKGPPATTTCEVRYVRY